MKVRFVFARIVDGRVTARFSDGTQAPLPLARRGCLVVSRADCDILCLRLPSSSGRRRREYLARELPRAYPGMLTGYVHDHLLQPLGRESIAVVAIMKREAFSLYETAAGGAPVTLLSLLAPGLRRRTVRRNVLARRRSARLGSAARGRMPTRLRPLEEEFLIRDGPTAELATFRGPTLLSSFVLPASAPSGSGAAPLHPDATSITRCSNGSPCGPPAPVANSGRLSSGHRLFEEQRGVRRWTRGPLLSPLFLSIALPLLLSANFAAFSLVSRRVGEVETARAEVFRAARVTKANASPHATVGPSQPHAAAPRLPDPYSILCALRRAAGRSATVGAVSLSRGTIIVELQAADPLDVLRRIESDPSVASAELQRAGGREPDGRLPATVKVVYR